MVIYKPYNNTMKKYLLILTAMLCSIATMAQNTDAMLFGDVKAKEGGQHLAHAVIQVKVPILKHSAMPLDTSN